MPFPDQAPLGYNQVTVESLDPNQFGCYGLHDSRGWIYVGKGDIRARLLSHLNGDNPCIAALRPTHFVTVLADNQQDMNGLEKRLIAEYQPVCNLRVG